MMHTGDGLHHCDSLERSYSAAAAGVAQVWMQSRLPVYVLVYLAGHIVTESSGRK